MFVGCGQIGSGRIVEIGFQIGSAASGFQTSFQTEFDTHHPRNSAVQIVQALHIAAGSVRYVGFAVAETANSPESIDFPLLPDTTATHKIELNSEARSSSNFATHIALNNMFAILAHLCILGSFSPSSVL